MEINISLSDDHKLPSQVPPSCKITQLRRLVLHGIAFKHGGESLNPILTILVEQNHSTLEELIVCLGSKSHYLPTIFNRDTLTSALDFPQLRYLSIPYGMYMLYSIIIKILNESLLINDFRLTSILYLVSAILVIPLESCPKLEGRIDIKNDQFQRFFPSIVTQVTSLKLDTLDLFPPNEEQQQQQQEQKEIAMDGNAISLKKLTIGKSVCGIAIDIGKNQYSYLFQGNC